MTTAWIIFALIIIGMLALDLGVFHKQTKAQSVKDALKWSGIWISLALLFNAGIYFYLNQTLALEFLTGYVMEKSLSIDNIFVFVIVFKAFRIGPEFQHRILFWGIIGALILRALFIFLGIALISKFHWIIYVFGFFLVITGIKLWKEKKAEEGVEEQEGKIIVFLRRHFTILPVKDRFLVTQNGRKFMTSALACLLVIELSDLIFAIDSIPAILSVTQEPFIVFTSNIFAILGLRSLYFALSGIIDLFKYLHYGLSIILTFVGLKMLVSDLVHVPISVSLAVILSVLALSVLVSVYLKEKEN